MHAGEDLDQRRFAGAVVADQRHDLAGMHVEIDVGQRRNRAEILGDAAQAEHQFAPSLRFSDGICHALALRRYQRARSAVRPPIAAGPTLSD